MNPARSMSQAYRWFFIGLFALIFPTQNSLALEITSPLLKAEKSVQEMIYPDLKPYNEGYLKIPPLHSLWFAEYGNKTGIPVLVLHGGPGFGTGSSYMRHFDPGVY